MADKSNIMLGEGVIRVADSSTYLTNTGVALSALDKQGITVECTLDVEYSYRERRPVGYFYPKKIVLTGGTADLTMKFAEASQENLNMMFGGNIVSGEFYIGPKENHFRTEITFTYPDKINRAIYILPKCRVVNPQSINLRALDEPWMPIIKARVLNPGNSQWGINLGKITFDTI